MTSKVYWEHRQALDMVEYMRTADKTAALMQADANRAMKSLEREIKAVVGGLKGFGISETEARRILSADGTALQKLRRAAQKVQDPTKRAALLNAINSAGAYRARIQRYQQVEKQIAQQCNALYKAQVARTTAALQNVASSAYYHTIFNLQQQTGLGFDFAQFPKTQIDRLLAAHWVGTSYSQRIWGNTNTLAKHLKDELLISLLSGRSNAKTMKAIRDRFGTNSYCAWRLVRTESTYIANAAIGKGYEEAGIERYRFLATLDSRTSEECAELDGKVFDLKDRKPGTNYPPMHPFCRSTTLAEFGAGTLEGLQRRAKDADGNTIKVPADMTYKEWAKEHISANSPEKSLDKSVESGIMRMGKVKGAYKQVPPDFSEYQVNDDAVAVESVRQLIISELGIPDNNVDLLGIRNAEVLEPFAKQLIRIRKETGLSVPKIKASAIIDGDRCCIAGYKPYENTLYISSEYFNSKNALLGTLKTWANNGVIPKQATTIRYLAEHEAAHIKISEDLLNTDEAKDIFRKRKLINDNDAVVSEFYADVVAIYRTSSNPSADIVKAIEYLKREGVKL